MDTISPELTDLCHELGLREQFVLDLIESVESDHVRMYESFFRHKKSGGVRQIDASKGPLKRFQRSLHDEMLSKYPLPDFVHGCVKKRSIVTNASPHVGKEVVINLDLVDFFHTIDYERVNGLFQTEFGCSEELSRLLAKCTTYKGSLPIGAPSSPALANIAALPLDKQIIETCTACLPPNSFAYTRYVDDITISGTKELADKLSAIFAIIDASPFKRNTGKTRIMRKSTRQWVTGVVVNKKTNPPRKLLRKISQALYFCEKWGLLEHCETKGLKPHNFVRKLDGYIGYLRLTQPVTADLFQLRFNQIKAMLEPSEEEEMLQLFKKIIDHEDIAHFRYDSRHCTAVPVSIFVDEHGMISIKAFQLHPEQEWTTYSLMYVDQLRHRGKVS